MVPAGRDGLRFYAALSLGQRQALWEQHRLALDSHHTSPAFLVAVLREGPWDLEWSRSAEKLAGASITLRRSGSSA